MHFTAHFFTAFYQKESKLQGMKVQVKPALKNINVCHHCRQAFLGIFLATGVSWNLPPTRHITLEDVFQNQFP